jgi:stage V sporulation protein R
MHDYTITDLEKWDRKIRKIAEGEGLDPFPQEFEICDYHDMIGYEAYAGMPSHYPHWSFGKSFERKETLYQLGIVGLPYEMVINSNPTLAYLLRDNTLLLQILTIAHVYGHNDFFKNNMTFSRTRPEYTSERFKAHADRVRSYIEDPSIGAQKVERILDAAHALQFQCRRAKGVKKRTVEGQRAAAMMKAKPAEDPFATIHQKQPYEPPDLTRVPLEPEEDILLFIRDHNPYLEAWGKDLITIVLERADYFLPQIETKIMNEGWASYWHYRILDKLNLPQGLQFEFLKRHNQVIRPSRGGLNPYHLGYKIFEDVFERWENPTEEEQATYDRPGGEGREKIFQIRESDRDASFLRQYLTEDLMRELDLFQHDKKGKDRVITHISSPDDWKTVKESLLRSVGLGNIPVIKILEVKTNGAQEMVLCHEFDGRELDAEYADRTIRYVQQLWGKKVILETRLGGECCQMSYDGQGDKVDVSRS